MEQDNLIKNQNLFPRTTDIPQTVLKDIPCIQTGYLADGEIQVRDDPRQEVLSPVWVVGSMDPKPFFIGEYPLLTEAEALQALDAAVAAYDHGIRQSQLAGADWHEQDGQCLEKTAP